MITVKIVIIGAGAREVQQDECLTKYDMNYALYTIVRLLHLVDISRSSVAILLSVYMILVLVQFIRSHMKLCNWGPVCV